MLSRYGVRVAGSEDTPELSVTLRKAYGYTTSCMPGFIGCMVFISGLFLGSFAELQKSDY